MALLRVFLSIPGFNSMQNHVANFRSVQFMSQHDATRDMDQGFQVYIDLPQCPLQNKLPISTF